MFTDDASKNIILSDDENKLIGKNLTDLSLKVADVTKPVRDLIASFDEVNKRIAEADKGAFSLVGKMGLNEDAAKRIKRSFGEAYNELGLIGADFGTFVKTQEDFNTATGRNVILTKQNLNDLISTNKVTGVAAGTLLSSFQNAGFSMSQITKNMEKVVTLSSSMGLNSQLVSKLVTDNLEKLNKFGFGNGVEGLAKMAAKAASLRMDMTSAFKVAGDIFDRGPEAAIEISATLQRMGATSGALLDPLKLMDLAQNNVPELQNQLVELSKQYTVFNEDTKQFEIMPGARKQLNEVAKSLGLSYEEFAKMSLESSKMEKKLSEIDFSKFDKSLTEEQKSLITNMAEMNESGEYVVKVKDAKGVEIEKAINKLDQGDLLQLQQQTLTDGEKMYDIASQSLSQLERIGNLQETSAKAMSTMFATGEYGNSVLEELVKGNDKLYGVTAENRMGGVLETLSLNNIKLNENQKELAKTTGEMLQAAANEDPVTAGKKYLESMSQMFSKFVKPGIEKTGVGEDLKSGDYGTVAAKLLTKAVVTEVATFFTNLTEYITSPEKLKKAFTVKPTGDLAVTADGIHYALDKGDMLMAVNQNALASAIGVSTPSPILPTSVDNNFASKEGKKESTPKEINVNVNFTHESKGADINVAQEFSKGLRDNTALQQQITQTITQTLTNYGLTVG
jgi:hypothetical protein